jgi:hypothetical protein
MTSAEIWLQLFQKAENTSADALEALIQQMRESADVGFLLSGEPDDTNETFVLFTDGSVLKYTSDTDQPCSEKNLDTGSATG